MLNDQYFHGCNAAFEKLGFGVDPMQARLAYNQVKKEGPPSREKLMGISAATHGLGSTLGWALAGVISSMSRRAPKLFWGGMPAAGLVGAGLGAYQGANMDPEEIHQRQLKTLKEMAEG